MNTLAIPYLRIYTDRECHKENPTEEPIAPSYALRSFNAFMTGLKTIRKIYLRFEYSGGPPWRIVKSKKNPLYLYILESFKEFITGFENCEEDYGKV